jgi:membrane-bound lytic murein transglycosylase MltF
LLKKLIFLIIVLASLIVFLTYKKHESGKVPNQSSFEPDAIKTRKDVIAVIDLQSDDYSTPRGEMMGLNYGLTRSIQHKPVSKYDDLIREFSNNINWDWRLLASLICQESQFKPDVISVAGAYGLMQIMPVTGRNFGIDITASPKNNIRAGIMYISWLNKLFESKVPDQQERLYFILAAYNAGPGHVLDAMRLAGKNGMDPQKWEGNVAVWLLKKSEPQYYRDSVVRNGYFRGKESVKFVSEVLDRFEHYKNIIPQEKSRPF